MSLEALWTIEFQATDDWVNGGVVVLETNRIYGGDSDYFYVGTYEVAGETLNADVHVRHYHGQPGTAFGDSATDFWVTLQARREGNAMTGAIRRKDQPQLPELAARLTWRADLP